MKQKLLKSIIMLLCMMMSAWAGLQAQNWTASTPAEGDFYLYNVGAERFMTSGTYWGSHASLDPHGAMTLTLASTSGGYTISTSSIYSGKYLGDNNYMDNENSAVWVFEAVDGLEKTYKIKLNGTSEYLYNAGNNAVERGTENTNDYYWKLVTKDNLVANLPNATSTNPIDATFYITASWIAKGIGAAYGNGGYTPQGWSGTTATDTWGCDGPHLYANYCVEQYEKTFDNYQEFTVPNGEYKLSAQGFYRGEVKPYFYANGNTSELAARDDSEISVDWTVLKDPELSDWELSSGKPNSIRTAAYAFQNGYYQINDITTSVTDGTLRIGVKSDEDIDWCAFDNFSLVCTAVYLDQYAVALPNDLNTTLTADQWYYYDNDLTDFQTLEGNISDIVYTTNGLQAIADPSVTPVTQTMFMHIGRIFFKATSSGATLKITQPAPTITSGTSAGTGDYYIYNLGARRYLSRGSTYTTHATVDGAGSVITISGSADEYFLHYPGIAATGFLSNGGWIDGYDGRDDYTTWAFEPVTVSGYTNVYKLKANTGGNYLYWAGGLYVYGNEAIVGDISDKTLNAYWILIPKATREDYSAASTSNPVDVTYLMSNPDFEANIGAADNWTGDFVIQSNGAYGTEAQYIEKWVWGAGLNDYTTTQTVGLPAGRYRVTARAAAERQDDPDMTITGTYLFGGNNKTEVTALDTYSVDCINSGNGIKIGMQTQSTTANWVRFDNFRLYYLGNDFLPLPNDNETELSVGQWYYYDASAVGPYTLEGPVANIVYTQNGDNLIEANPTTKTAQSKLILDAGRVYFQATAAGATLKVTSVNAEGINDTFTVASLNVDGLPTIKIGSISVNPDGRGADGATDISKYLMMAGKRYDLIAVQEDFDYNSELVSEFGTTYGQGTWRGAINKATAAAAYLAGTDGCNTDGLNFFWNKDNGLEAGSESWERYSSVAKTEGNHLVRKGFRYYEVTLADGLKVDVYITHMDAGNTDNGATDSRNSQWTQLATAVIANPFTTRPKIIMGDFNSRYTRDNIIANFIVPVKTTGNYEVNDAWIELVRGGSYPSVGDVSLSNEVVDKIIYLNPTATGTAQLTALSYKRETDYTVGTVYGTEDNTDLGDHGPIVVQFRISKPAVQYPEEKDRWTWTGEEATYEAINWYLYNVHYGANDEGGQGFLTSDATLVRDPNLSNVHMFGLWGNASGASISNDYNKLRMDYIAGRATYVADLLSSSETGATTFQIQDASSYALTTNQAYHFYAKINLRDYRYGANNTTTLSAQRTASEKNAWALISSAQVQQYNRYCAAWDKGITYVNYLPLKEETIEAMNKLLQRTGVRWTDTTTSDLEALNAEIEAWFDDNETALIQNPSFELDAAGNALTIGVSSTANGVVPGWTVPNLTGTFVSHKDTGEGGDAGEDGWSRNFNDVDGNYVCNLFDDNATATNFYVRQTISGLPEGFYKLKAVACTDKGNSVSLQIGSTTQTTPFTVSRPYSQHLEVPLYYHDGESDLVIGASSNTWFEIDDFELYRYDYYYYETIGTAEYATTAIRYNTEIPAGVEVYYATSINAADGDTGDKVRNYIHLEKYDGNQINAGEGVILYKAGNDRARQFRFYRTNETVENIEDNILHGAVNRIEADDKSPGCNYYVLAKKYITYDKVVESVNETTGEVTSEKVETYEPVVGFYRLDANTAIPAHKAYIRVNVLNELAVKGYIFSFGNTEEPQNEETTGVQRAREDAEIVGIYSLDGTRQNQLQRGINLLRLSNGNVKKVLVK